MKLRDYAFDEEGKPLAGVPVEVYKAGASLPTDTGVTDSSGAWEFSQLEPGEYDVKIAPPSGKPTFWRKGNVAVQVQQIVGLDGVSAPLPNNSVSKDQLRTNAVAESGVTIDEGQTVTTNSGTVKTLLSTLARVIRSVTGKSMWWELPPISLADLDKHGSRHTSTGADPIPVATQSVSGLMSPQDKRKLDNIPEGGSAPHHHDDRYAPINHHHDDRYALINHTHTNVNASYLNGVDGNRFMYLLGGHTGGSQWSGSGPWRVVAGAQVVNFNSSGVATSKINFPVAFPNQVLLIICNAASGSYFRDTVLPYTSDRTGFTPCRVTQAAYTDVLVNYIAFGR